MFKFTLSIDNNHQIDGVKTLYTMPMHSRIDTNNGTSAVEIVSMQSFVLLIGHKSIMYFRICKYENNNGSSLSSDNLFAL